MPVAVSQARNTERVSRNLWLKELTRIQPQSLRPQQRRDSPRPWSPCWTLTRYSSSQAGPVSDAGTALKAPAPAPASPRRPQPWTLGRLPGPAAHLAPVGGPGRRARERKVAETGSWSPFPWSTAGQKADWTRQTGPEKQPTPTRARGTAQHRAALSSRPFIRTGPVRAPRLPGRSRSSR